MPVKMTYSKHAVKKGEFMNKRSACGDCPFRTATGGRKKLG